MPTTRFLSLRLLGSYLILFLLVLSSCNRRDSVSRKKVVVAALPYADPAAFAGEMKGVEGKTADSIYTSFFDALLDSNKIYLLEKHLPYYDKLQGGRKTAAALLAQSRGWITNFYAHYDSSIAYFQQSAKAYRQLADTYGLARSYFGIGINYKYLGNYQEMFRYELKAVHLFETIRDSFNIYKTKIDLAEGFSILGEYDKAIALLEPCIAHYTRIRHWDAVAYSRSVLSNVYQQKGEYRKAIQGAEAAMKIREQLKDSAGICASLNNIANAYSRLEQYDKALEGLERSLVLLRLMKDKRNELVVQKNIAYCLGYMGRYDEAEALLLGLVETAKQRGQKFTLRNSYQLLAEFNKDQSRFQPALSYYILYKTYSDSLFNEEKAKATEELLIRYETAKKEAHIVQLTHEKKLDKTRRWLYLSLLFLTLSSSVFLFIVLRSRNKSNKLQLEKVSQELAGNIQALQSFTDQVIRKNRQIEELEEQVRISEQQVNEAAAEAQNSGQLSQLYQLKILTEVDWQNFKILFDKVHPGFINKLRDQFPEISPSEERQSLLIKLNISNKECAAMLGISVDSVKKTRYRLKKRILLNEDADLDEFVRSM